jgi:NitT/TauT family transport system substrate-binding protein
MLADMIGRGELDFALFFAASAVFRLDSGVPITALAGVHPGCFELFAHEPIRTISDLKGKKVGIDILGSGGHLYVASMVANVGLDPQKDINWITPGPTETTMQLFAERKIDAFLGWPVEPQELRDRGIGHVIVNTAMDKPWSQYFCCILCGNRDFVRQHPVATKRVVRATLKANDICAAEPERAAQLLIDAGYAQRYDYALQTLTELPYATWREFDPEDALRFFALRLHEAGMIKSSPNALLAEGTDWRFLNELKRELKA